MRVVYTSLLPLVGDPAKAAARARQIALAWPFRRRGGMPDGHKVSGGSWSDGTHEISWSTHETAGSDLCAWELTWRQPNRDDPDVCWQSEVTVGRDGGESWAAVRVALIPTSHRVRPLDFRFEPPRVVSDLVEQLDIRVDGRQLHPRAAGVWQREVDELVDFLEDPSRVLPVLAVSCPISSGPLVDANSAASRLLGLAHVVVLEEPAAAFRLTDLVGKQLSVFNGAVRLYYPGFNRGADPYLHTLWLPTRIEQLQVRISLERLLVRRLAALGGFRTPAPALKAAILGQQAAHRRVEIEELRARVESGQVEYRSLEDQLLESWRNEEALRRELEGVRAELAAVQASFIQVAGAQGDVGGAEDRMEEPPPPRTVAEAVERVRDRAQYLTFLEDAVESAARCPYRQPERVLEALDALEEVAGRWHHKERMPKGIEGALGEFNFDYAADVGDTTKGKYRQEYERTYMGERVRLGPHLRLGKGSPDTCARIYFLKDEGRRIFVIGHIGHHLRDSTSG